jgi:hypothetical protein
MYVYPDVGSVGPVPFTSSLLFPVVQSKHLTPLRIVKEEPIKVCVYEPVTSFTVVPDPE